MNEAGANNAPYTYLKRQRGRRSLDIADDRGTVKKDDNIPLARQWQSIRTRYCMISSESQEIFALLSSVAKFEVACKLQWFFHKTPAHDANTDVIRKSNRGEFYEICSNGIERTASVTE